MFLAALIVGAVTAWSYGPRKGLTAAGVALALFVVAALIPALTLYIYLAIGIGVAGLAALAPRRPQHPVTARAVELGKMALKRLRK